MKKNLAPIWRSIAEVIAAQVSPDAFQRWFRAIELLDADEEKLLLAVPNNIYQFWIEDNYMPLVNRAIESVLGAPHKVFFTVEHKADEEHTGTPAAAAGDLEAVEAATASSNG